MAKLLHKGKRKAVKAAAHKVAGRSASVMNPEYLALIENFRLMDDAFMSKCFENAPECIELMLRIILGKKDLKVQGFRRREACHVQSSRRIRATSRGRG